MIYTQFDNKLTAGFISETEAYAGAIDKASHAYNNRRTNRTDVMFGQGGISYVYLCYGVHYLFNFVTNRNDIPHAVLLRGIIPYEGFEIMKQRTGKNKPGRGFSDGPGKVTKALGINIQHNKLDLLGNSIWVEDKGIVIKKNEIHIGSRIGVQYAGADAKLPYRFLYKNLSYPRHKKTPLNLREVLFFKSENYLTESDNSLPALNLTTFLAAILISLPVCGLRPVRAARLETAKEPNPTRATLSPFFRALEVAPTNASRALLASALVKFASAAIASINSALFIFNNI